GSAAQQMATRHTLVTILEQLLRLLHPLLPFITEAIWERVAPLAGVQGETIMLQAYPQVQAERFATASEDVEWLKQVIEGIRNIRGEMSLSPARPLPLLVLTSDEQAQRRLRDNANFLSALAKLETLEFLNNEQELPATATALVGKTELHIPMAGLIDKDAELARLDKAIQKAQQDVDRVRHKLSNEKFVANAPADVIEKERAKQADAEQTLAQLHQQRERIALI